MLPDFIIIGAMKCGTSSLYHYLSLHPQVGMSDIKEVDFFIAENNFDKGIGWYESQFQGNFDTFGEASPNYTKAHYFQGVPRRMHELLPDVKLIYLVRDPVERLISHYLHNYSEGREHRSIEEALSTLEENHYVLCSRYFWQLEHYLTYFDREQLLIVPSYQLKTNRRETLSRIFDFIGVDTSFYTDEFEQERHKSSKKRRKGRFSRYLLESPIIKQLKGFVPDAVKNLIKRATRPEVSRPELSPSLRTRLQDYLRADVKQLQELSGHEFTSWKL